MIPASLLPASSPVYFMLFGFAHPSYGLCAVGGI